MKPSRSLALVDPLAVPRLPFGQLLIDKADGTIWQIVDRLTNWHHLTLEHRPDLGLPGCMLAGIRLPDRIVRAADLPAAYRSGVVVR